MAAKEPEKLRLNRAIAATGICSRRDADELVKARRVKVNGVIVDDLSMQVDLAKDRIQVDGKPLYKKAYDYVVLYKPKGVVTTCDDEKGRRTVLDLLPPDLQHLKPVGRLDRDSEGMIILTNDGALAQTLTHPSHHIDKTYRVTVDGHIDQNALKTLSEGVRLSEGITQRAHVHSLKRSGNLSTFVIVISEGRNRQIRRMCAKVGYNVLRLVRERIGALQLNLKEPGQWRQLMASEVSLLKVSK
ncbi:MAG TPA: rRNA pseudouridine synthase [Candidatus Melainabacteria bacterium]|nr:rRNA pseudouridine synthase [Candidatus Melainabacteria bacterium]HIN63665.1 rRNA pseudouridine synthase [Candidatus Obscuribacterales bacterium]